MNFYCVIQLRAWFWRPLMVLLLCAISVTGWATGTATVQSADSDPVMLFVGEETFGNFAAYDGPENSRLNFRISSVGEVVYFGFGRAYKSNGMPESFGQYKFRVRSAATGEVVFGPHTINVNTENLTSLAQAAAGPDALNAVGYPTNNSSTFTPAATGDYYVEFDQSRNRPRYIGLWDITIARGNQTQTGRVFSKNWAFRVPEVEPQQPYCSFGAELNSEFYSYTDDGFVTRIDFSNSGFQPLSFNLAFNRVGPGNSGDLVADRQSVPFVNATDNAAEHLIFLEEPDAVLFPDGDCGIAETAGALQCTGENEFCIPVTFSQPGQADILLDFNQNGLFDEGLDRILVYAAEDGDLTPCVPWDGLLGDGSLPLEGTLVDIQLSFSQGVQHWSLYDGELMRNGFCVEPIRPACSVSASTPLYYDDEKIVEEPGTGGPKRELEGCDCQTDDCRTWTNFEANASADCIITDNLTTGYGDRNTLNTWWFAFSIRSSQLDIPVTISQIEGLADHCPGEEVTLNLVVNTTNTVTSVNWQGPSGPVAAGDDQTVVTVTESGLYSATVIDDTGCSNTSDFALADVNCSLQVNVLSVNCSDNGTDTNPADDTFTATVRVEGDNSGAYIYNGSSYAYGETVEIGPFLIADGDVDFTATDDFYSCCRESVTIPAPAACSDGCAITGVAITSVTCSDAGTPTDPSDDTFVFSMIVTGVNGGDNWVDVDSMLSGAYDVENVFGPFLIANGDLTFYFQDENDPDCAIATVVQAPNTCSNECILTPEVANVVCLDNGTPYDASDDNYLFDLTVTSDNAPSVGYSIDGSGAYLYGATNTVGPFPIMGADFTFDITDLGGPGCNLTFTLPAPPESCSDACGLTVDDVLLTCAADGSADEGRLTIELLVNNLNANSSSWTAGNGTVGQYGEYTSIGALTQGGADFTFVISETERSSCSLTQTVRSPEVSVTCPPDVATATFPMTTQAFGAAAGAGEGGTCYLPAEAITPDLRTGRLTVRTNASVAGGREVVTLYLFGLPGQGLSAAAFAQQAEETLSCDNLAAVSGTNSTTGNLGVPALPDDLVPGGLEPYGSLTIQMGPAEVFSLVTSITGSSMDGGYTYVALLAEGSTLEVRQATGEEVATTVTPASLTFPLSQDQAQSWFNDPASVDALGSIIADEVCGPSSVRTRDTLLGTCASARMVRRFDLLLRDTLLTDVCTQDVAITFAAVTDVLWPRARFQFQCDESYPTLENGAPSPDYTGYPTLYRDGIPTLLDGRLIDALTVDFVDTESVDEDGQLILTRVWTVKDACTSDVAEFTQIFFLKGGGQPFFECPISNHYCPIVEEDIMVWGMDELECTATIVLPEPEISGVCDSTGWTFTTQVYRITEMGDSILFRTLTDGDDRVLADLPAGDYLLYFTGDHGEQTIDGRYCRFRVADLENPTVVCRSNLNVSLPGNGLVRISPEMIDLGSYDNCQVESIGLRERSGGIDSLPFQNALIFGCEDVGSRMLVDLRVVDVTGNENYCTATILVRDETDPYCTGLDPVTISCADLPDGFDAYDTLSLRLLFGEPDVVDNCAAFSTELPPTITGSACSPETIRRAFRATDQHGNLSRNIFYQEVTIVPALGYAIQLPSDVITECPADATAPQITGGACDSISVEFVDVDLDAQPGDCRLIQRTYTLTSWCEWNGTDAATMIDRDENCTATAGAASLWLVRTPQGAFLDVDDDSSNSLPPANTCGNNSDGYLRQMAGGGVGRYQYTQLIRIQDTAAPEVAVMVPDTVCTDDNTCEVELSIAVEVTNACQGGGGSLSITVDINGDGSIDGAGGEFGSIVGAYPDYAYVATLPVGSHDLVFAVTDGCGNVTTVSRKVAVTDCFVPFLFALEDRSYTLESLPEGGESGAALVSAIDLAACTEGDCSNNLVYSINRVGETPDISSSSLFVTCEDRYRIRLEVYVWDSSFNPYRTQPDGSVGGPNWRMREISVRVTDPNQTCTDCQVGDLITINGLVTTRLGDPMAGVTVHRDEGMEAQTNRLGSYQLPGRIDESYTLRAELKNADKRAGLSTIDLLILRSHIVGVKPITDPHQRIAADLNQDGLVNVQDMVLLQGLIIGNETFYPNTEPWLFVNEKWDGRGDPVRVIPVANSLHCTDGHNFIGVRLGDLNGSAAPPTQLRNGAEEVAADF